MPAGEIQLADVAHGRSGDKGNHANVAVLAYTAAGFAWLKEQLTVDVVRRYFEPLGPSCVERCEAPNLLGLNFVLYDVLAGGASRSLRTDTQGKTLALATLRMRLPRPDDLEAMTRPKPEGIRMSDDLILYELRPPAAVLTLNRPDRRNALSRPLIAALADAFGRAADDPAVRCVILTGAGAAFCAGMDLAELQESLTGKGEESPVWRDALHLADLYERIYASPKPTIAAVNGAAVAGGAGLVSVCDLAAAAPEAKFGYPEVRRGLVAAMVMPHLLRHVGERTARYLLLTGEMIGAEEARQAGFINAVTPAPRLMETALAWARQLAEGGPQALALTKDLLHRFSRQAVGMEEAATASAAPRLSEECRQGLEAFFARRPAPWASAQGGGRKAE